MGTVFGTNNNGYEQLITSVTRLVSNTNPIWGTEDSLTGSYGGTPMTHLLACTLCHRNLGDAALILTHSVQNARREEECACSFHMECLLPGSMDLCIDDIFCYGCGHELPQPEHNSLAELLYLADGYEYHASNALATTRDNLHAVAFKLQAFMHDRKDAALQFSLNQHSILRGANGDQNLYEATAQVTQLIDASAILMDRFVIHYLEAVYAHTRANITQLYDCILADYCAGRCDYNEACRMMSEKLCPSLNPDVAISVDGLLGFVIRRTTSVAAENAIDLMPDEVIRVFCMLMAHGLAACLVETVA